MEVYDYRETLKEDIKQYIEENYDKDEIVKHLATDRDDFSSSLYDTLWTEDSVTGNGSGSYTFNTYDAEENLCHNLDLLIEAADNFGGDVGSYIRDGAEACDVTIRCYLLGEVLGEVLDEYENTFAVEIEEYQGNSDEEDDEEE